MKSKLFLFIILSIASSKIYSADYTKISPWNGEITNSETWSGTIFIAKYIKLKNNAVITVSPGTVIKMGHQTGISELNGQLKLKGTIESPIIITSIDDNSHGVTIDDYEGTSDGDPSPGDWGGISLRASKITVSNVNIYYGATKSNNSSNAALYIYNTDTCVISNCNISYSGANGAIIDKNASLYNCNFSYNGEHGLTTTISTIDSLSFYNCTFSHNDKDGVHATVYAGDVSANGCTFENNEDVGLYMSGSNSSIGSDLPAYCLIASCTFRDNGSYPVSLNTMNLSSPFKDNTVENNTYNAFLINSVRGGFNASLHSNGGIPYIFNNLGIYSDTLTINKGTIVKVQNNPLSSLETRNNAFLIINGSKDNPVIFTAIEDDNVGGDTNNDALQTLPVYRNLMRIKKGAKIAYTQFLYSNIFVSNDAKAHFKHCHFENAQPQKEGETASALSGNADMDSCTFTNNYWGFVPNVYKDTAHVSNCIFLNNEEGIRILGEDISIRNNLFENNRIGVNIWDARDYHYIFLGKNLNDSIGNNTFTANRAYDIYNDTPIEIYAIGNKFDGTTAPEIDAKIYDDNEKSSSGKVIFSPWIQPQSTLTFLASVNGQLGVGVEISINGSTITTNADGKASIDLPNGDYQYTYSYSGNTSNNINISFTDDKNVKIVIVTTGTTKNSTQQITLFPNPVKDILHIKSEHPINRVEFFSTTGRLLHVAPVVETGRNLSLPMTHIPQGIILVKIRTNTGVRIQRIVNTILP